MLRKLLLVPALFVLVPIVLAQSSHWEWFYDGTVTDSRGVFVETIPNSLYEVRPGNEVWQYNMTSHEWEYDHTIVGH